MKFKCKLGKIILLIMILVWPAIANANDNEIVWGISRLPFSDVDLTIQKFGFNADVDTTEESVWDMHDLPTSGAGPLRCFTNIPSAVNLYVSSDSSADAGLGIAIEVLDSAYAGSLVTMNLGSANGTGTAFTQIGGTTLLRVNRAYSTGTGFTGNIYIHKDSVDGDADGIPESPSTNIVAGITAGENQTLQACYTVPLGFNAASTSWCISNVSQLAVGTAVTFRSRISLNGAGVRTQILLSLGDETTQCHVAVPSNIFPEKTDVEVTGSDASSQSAAVVFGIMLVEN